MRKISHLFIAAMMAAGLLASPTTFAQNIIVDGNMWMKSSPEIRKVFLIGAGNMAALEKAYATKKNLQQPPAAEMAAKAVHNMPLDQISERITRWYVANPDRQNVPVMGVIWMDIVKPATDK